MEDFDMTPGTLVAVICDCGRVLLGKVVGDEGQLLEWECPVCGFKRDVNA